MTNNYKEIVYNARSAFNSWSRLPLSHRAEIVLRFAKKIEESKDELAKLISEEIGKPFWESKTEVQSTAAKAQIALDAFKLRYPENFRELPQGIAITRHKPHGVALVLGPYNFPIHLPNGHIIPALLAGNTVVFKPSEHAPRSAALYVEIWKEAGLPKGVLQIVKGDKETGAALLNENFNLILFTGSLQTGLFLLKKFADRPEVIVALEMGGNNPLVVSDIADLHAASCLTIQSAFLTSGQRCTAARRLILPKGKSKGKINDAFIKELVHMTEQVKVGLWHEKPEPFMGPVVSIEAAKKIQSAWFDLIKKGGIPLLDLKASFSDEALLSPGIIDVTGIADIPDEEIFGPVLKVIRVDSFDEAIAEANRTKYGLSAGLFSDSKEEYEYFFEHINAGIINWNSPLTGASSHAPFGGIGFSGNGRPSALYAADYSAYPVASIETNKLKIPASLPPGLQGVKN